MDMSVAWAARLWVAVMVELQHNAAQGERCAGARGGLKARGGLEASGALLRRQPSPHSQPEPRLELYMKQNHENVERAEKELNALHEDMEQTLELQRRLAQRATTLEKEKKELEQALQKSVQEFEAERSALQCKIARLTDDLHARADAEAQALSLQAELERTLEAKAKLEEEIQISSSEAGDLTRKADEFSRELQNLLSKERQSQAVERQSRKPLLRRMFYALRDAAERQRASKCYEQAAVAFSNENCCRHGFHAMHLAMLRSRWMRQAHRRQTKACMRDVWRAWLLAKIADKKYHDALQHRKRSCLRKSFCRWQSILGMGKLSADDERQLTELARMFWKNCVCRRTSYAASHCCMEILYTLVSCQKVETQASLLQGTAMVPKEIFTQVLAVWRHNIKFQQAEMRAVQEVNQALMKAAFILWREYDVLCAIKKKKERKADAFRRRRGQKMAKDALLSWWDSMAWKRRALQLERLLASRRQHTLLVIAFHCWMHSTFENLLITNAKVQNDLMEAKALFEEQKHQTTAVDVENLQLIDRLHTMSSEIAYLKMTIAEKEKQEDELHRALEDGAFIESSMRGELEQQHIRIEELELNILSLQKKLQSKNAEDTAEEVHHTLEIQNMEQAVNELQIQLAEKTSQLKSYEKALKETAEKLEGASDESQEKLSSAFKIASSLRKLLEDRENQYANLEGSCRRKELELEELQRKLAAANNSFSETVEARDARIQELESMLTQKHNEIHETQQEMQDLQLALDAKDNLVKKLEYEIKLKADQDLHKSKSFVSSLSAWPVGQCDSSSSGLRSHVHSIQLKESMRHVYTQAKAALQQGGSISAEGANCLRLASNLDSKATGVHWDSISATDQDVSETLGDQHHGDSPKDFSEEITNQEASPAAVLEKAANLLATYKEIAGESSRTYLRTVEVPAQEAGPTADWETSCTLLSAARPSSSVEITEPFALNTESNADATTGGSSEGSLTTVTSGSSLGTVDGLHIQIQRLQARIKSQLRDSHSEEKSKGRSQQRGSPRIGRGQHPDACFLSDPWFMVLNLILGQAYRLIGGMKLLLVSKMINLEQTSRSY
ncbi:hypothetical protein GOP47_0019573 [Adiantum capillus-veneris]|uniref:Uncharacterized protein n=1 Tax=Adiantum capillus-veneris TaxID=13818 RepID=A0A9D4UC99_ADICA|nr:hypothetical protein GOP47_0019573 [Adiantum capillus-veneris]